MTCLFGTYTSIRESHTILHYGFRGCEDYGIAWTYRIIDNYPYRTCTRIYLCRCLIYRIIDIPVYCGTVSPVPVVPVYLLAAAYCFGMRTALAGTEKFRGLE